MKNFSNIDHINMSCKNLEESTSWYKRVFGFEVVERGISQDNEPWAIIRASDSMLCLYQEPNRKVADQDELGTPIKLQRLYHFGFRLTNEQDWEDTIKREKLKPQYGGAINYPNSKSWYINDPSGHEIEVSVWKGNKVVF